MELFDAPDFHAHVLPLVDHGSDSVQTSLTQLRMAREFGVSRVIATPHFYPHEHSVDEFLDIRDTAYKKLLAETTDRSLYPELRLGCEVLFCEGISRLPRLDDFCIRGTKTLLLELPFSDFSPSYAIDVRNLISDGYRVVLAHANRYVTSSVECMLSAGAEIQLNADSLSGLFVSTRVKSWLSRGFVVAIGSDIHMTDSSAYKRFARALKRISGFKSVLHESDRIWNEAIL